MGQIEQLSFREKKKLSGSQDILYRMPRDTDAISSRTDGCQEVSDVLEENNSDDSDKTPAANTTTMVCALVPSLCACWAVGDLCCDLILGRTKDDTHEPHEGAPHRQARH